MTGMWKWNALLLALAACAPNQVQRAASVEDYCASGPATLARNVVHTRERKGLHEETMWAWTQNAHASVIAASPREGEAMRRVVRFVYAHPELDADAASAAVYSDCVRARKANTWWSAP